MFICEDEQYEAKAISADIIQKISDGLQPNDICILCKQLPDNYSRFIIEELHKNGIRARIENEYQDLIKEPIIDLVLNFVSCAINRKQPQKWESVISAVMDLYCNYGGEAGHSFDIIQDRIYHKLGDIRLLIKSGSYDSNPQPVISSIRELLDDCHIKGAFPAYRQGTYLDDLINHFTDLFTQELVIALGDWELAINNFSGAFSIPIMTIHKSKGLEYTAVYFVGLEDSAFWNFKNQPEEDRCAFFVALSRAKKAVTFTFCNKRSTIRNPHQSHYNINEFFELLQKPGIATVQKFGEIT